MDALDRLIVAQAAEYHRPPAAAPREAMWEAIVAARSGSAPVGTPELHVVRTAPAPKPNAEYRRWADRRWVALAAAASLLLATGVGLGRWWGESRAREAARQTGAPGAGASQVATTATPSPSTDRPAGDASGDSTTRAVPSDVTPDGRAPRAVELRGRPDDASSARTQQWISGRLTDVARARTVERPADRAADAAYDVATLQHFTAAEALLVSYRSERSNAALSDSMTVALDNRLSLWARQLLQDTRLLLDSPAGADPRRRQLLEDLELVLAQITRLGGVGGPSGPAAGERAAIDGTLQRGQVITRLRNAIPSGT
jgi:hypothetical protein